MANDISEIQKFMRERRSEKALDSWRKSVPTAGKIHGVYLSEINKIVKKYSSGGFELVEELWKDGYVEERILAAKILGKICKKNPRKALELVRKFSKGITNWAECDTLATQGIRPVAKTMQNEIVRLSKSLVRSSNIWERRFGIVLLINLKNEKQLKDEIKSIVSVVEGDREYYVRKAVEWINRVMEKME